MKKRTYLMLMGLLFCTFSANAQFFPCNTAEQITWNNIPNCSNQTYTFWYDQDLPFFQNIDADFQLDCADGTTFENVAWNLKIYHFTARFDSIEIEVIAEMENAQLLLTSGDCFDLETYACAKDEDGNGLVRLRSSVDEFQEYYLVLQGGAYDDIDHFNLTIKGLKTCLSNISYPLDTELTLDPPATFSTYNPGALVDFCYTINSTFGVNPIDYPHALILNFGDGWDQGSLWPFPPPSCDGQGEWGYFYNWESCATGEFFEQGFAYDGYSAQGCSGSPLDGDPGNNFGDGTGGCAQIGSSRPPLEFCWVIAVKNDPPPGIGNLDLSVTYATDCWSGSWMTSSCTPPFTEQFSFKATASCNDAPAMVTTEPSQCSNICTGSVWIDANGGTGGAYDYRVLDTDNAIVAEANNVTGTYSLVDICAGDYTVETLNLQTDCVASTAFTVEGVPPRAEIDYEQACPLEVFELNASINPPDDQATFEWYYEGNLVNNDTTFLTQNPGFYELYATDSMGCRSFPDTITIQYVIPLVTLTADDDFVCPGQAVTLTATGGVTYLWDDGSIDSTTVVFPVRDSTFAVTVTDEFGCEQIKDIDIDVFGVPQFDLSLSATDSFCTPTSLLLTATQTNNFSNYSFEWENGSTNLVVNLSPIYFGTYFHYTATTPFTNCTITDSIFVEPPLFPVLPDTIRRCPDPTATQVLTAFEGLPDDQFNTYTWSTGENTRSITIPVTPDTVTYSVTVSLDNCVRIGATTILPVEPGMATIQPIPYDYCFEQNVNLLAQMDGGIPPFSYDWLGTSDLDTNTIQVPGNLFDTVSVVITDAAGCSAFTEYAVEPLPPPSLIILGYSPTQGSFSNDITICQPQFIDLFTVGSFFDVFWSTGEVGQSILLYLDSPGVYFITAFATDFNGCTTETSITILYEPTPPVITNGQVFTCEGDPVTLTAQMDGAIDYQWSDGQIGPEIVIQPFSTAIYSVTATNVDGCSSVGEVFVETFPNPEPPLISCTATQTSLEFTWTEVPGETYNVMTIGGPQGTPIGNTYLVENLSPNETITIQVDVDNEFCSGSSQVSCTTLDCPDIDLLIDPVPPICLEDGTPYFVTGQIIGGNGTGTLIWSGPGIIDSGMALFDPILAGPGIHTITLEYMEDLCTYQAQMDIEVTGPIDQPLLNCTSTLTSITVNWNEIPDAIAYEATNFQGFNGTVIGNTYVIENLQPGTPVEIEVAALPANGCSGSASNIVCVTQNCPLVTLDVPADFSVCANDVPFTIPVNVQGGNFNGIFEWSGACIVDPNTGLIDPSSCGPGTYTIQVTYIEGPCSYTASISLTISPVPVADFIVSTTEICKNETLVVTGTGSAGDYNWDFGGANAVPGTGPGPHTLSWDTPGQKTISLFLTLDGCSSETFSQTVQVDPAITLPVINCADVTLTSLSFVWDNDPNVTAYDVVVLTGQTGTLSGNTYTVDGLSPNEDVTIELTAQTNSLCGAVSTIQTCTAFDCPDFEVIIDGPMAPVCPTAPPIQLTAMVTNGSGSGTFSWSGPGIIDANQGLFDPSTVGPGTYQIVTNYFEDPCPGSASVIITVDEQVSSAFSINPAPVCLTDPTTITYTGNASPAASFVWDFDGGVATPGVGPGPHQVTWSTAGTKNITLQVTDGDCDGLPETATVEVEAPLADPIITCLSDITSIQFAWDAVPGSTGYTVNVLTGQTGTQIGTSFLVQGLSPEEEVTIEVMALSDLSCGTTSATLTCFTNPCPNYEVLINAPASTFCTDDQSVAFFAEAIGSNNTGDFQWSGAGINSLTGVFSPASAGVGSHDITVTYTEGPCSYTETITVIVFPIPSATFDLVPDGCAQESIGITYTGTADAQATYDWDFGGGTVLSGSGSGPYEVQWDTTGDYTVSLLVTANGCSSAQENQVINIQPTAPAPEVSCSVTTLTDIIFTWIPEPGVNYTVEVLTGQTPTEVEDGIVRFLSNLQPNETVTIEVQADLGNGCPPVSTIQSCTTNPCPDVQLSLSIDPQICIGIDSLPTHLGGLVNGENPFPNAIYEGPGVLDQGVGIFSPTVAGAGTHVITMTYNDGPCTYIDSFGIEVVYVEQIINVRTECSPDNDSYTVLYDLVPNPMPQTIEGPPIPSGESYTFEVTNNGCIPDSTITVFKDCNCPGDPGTVINAIDGCTPDMVTAQHLGNASIPAGSALFFVLHTNSGNVIGDIIDIQSSPSFVAGSNTSVNTQYYISPVLFELDGNGEPIIDSGCIVANGGIPVAFTSPIDMVLPADTFRCNNEKVVIEPIYTGDLDFAWSPATGLNCTICEIPFASPSTTTTYTAVATNEFGCSTQDSITIFVDELPGGAVPNTPIIICTGEVLQYCLPDAVSYSWSGPSNYISSDQCLYFLEFDPAYAGTYTIDIEITPGCTITEILEVQTPPQLTVNAISPDMEVCPTDVFLLFADIENAVQYNWFPLGLTFTPDSSATLAFTQEDQLFTVVAQDSFGCFIQEVVIVERAIGCSFDPNEYVPPLSTLQGNTDQADRLAQPDQGNPIEGAGVQYQVFPNPTSGQLTVRLQGAELLRLELIDIYGRLLTIATVSGKNAQLDLGHLPPGSYWLSIHHEQGMAVEKVLVVRP